MPLHARTCASMGFASHRGLSGEVMMNWGNSTWAARLAMGHRCSLHAIRHRWAQQ
jgi:hypothetical protein